MQSKEFLDGFIHAAEMLGQEGDHRNADCSAAYEFLLAESHRLKKAPTTFGGLVVAFDKAVPAGTIEFRHEDGRIERLVGVAGPG